MSYQAPTPQTYCTRGPIAILGLHHPQSSTGAFVANLKHNVTPLYVQKLFTYSPPSASSVLKCCIGKGKGKAPTPTPSHAPLHFMTLDSPSSSVMEGVNAGPSNFSGNFSGMGENIPSSSQDSDDEIFWSIALIVMLISLWTPFVTLGYCLLNLRY
ncbi:hypothetical protein M422DRAFT_243558 [Sphaerobolus stellatus SS14]|nr:hypothetical protein M422DRAFT_243558 [Sphaerobolus stellatus SS14]